MTLTKAKNEVVAQAAASFYEDLTPPEQIAFDDLAERLRDAIKAKRPGYQISTVSLREAVFAVAAFDQASRGRATSPKAHLTTLALEP